MKRIGEALLTLILAAALAGVIADIRDTRIAHAQQGSSSLPSYPLGVHITTQTAAAVKTSAGTLHTLTVNTAGASAVISIYDLSGANCTGTPSNPVISITLPASGVLPGSLLYDKQFTNGICVQDTVASSDLTVTAF